MLLSKKRLRKEPSFGHVLLFVLCGALFWFQGCASLVNPLKTEAKMDHPLLPSGTVIDTRSQKEITFPELLDRLSDIQIIYIGEQHTERGHHNFQLKLLKSLHAMSPGLAVGMEMFDRSYQAILNKWSSGKLSTEAFIEKTHWYANWRYDFSLYEEILLFTKEKKVTVLGLNIPFHIPAKVATGGLSSLLLPDKTLLPDTIDLNDAEHRAFVKEVFTQHPPLKGREKFDFFYEAQCLWEDAMAETISLYSGNEKMVVLMGNGHIQKKFGVPDRAYKRKKAPFRTIYLQSMDEPIDYTMADFIYLTPKGSSKGHPLRKKVTGG